MLAELAVSESIVLAQVSRMLDVGMMLKRRCMVLSMASVGVTQ